MPAMRILARAGSVDGQATALKNNAMRQSSSPEIATAYSCGYAQSHSLRGS